MDFRRTKEDMEEVRRKTGGEEVNAIWLEELFVLLVFRTR